MKQFFTIWLLLLIVVRASSQNLVPNNSFENYNAIPSGYGQWYNCQNWNDVNNHAGFAWPWASPDYLHTSASFASGVQLPSTTFGTINAHTGSAAMGFAAWLLNTANYREYMAVHLTSPMTVGIAYQVSFYITNGTNNYNGSGCDHIAVNFSSAPLAQTDHEPLTSISPQCVYAGQLWSTAWTQVSFTYTPTSAYQYITIGNFKDDASTAHTWHSVGFDGAYYFIDDVVVQPVVPLPVQLVSFNGNRIAGRNILQWQTASEFNSDHFSLEKSVDGNYFEEIASVAAKGFTNEISDYEYADATALHTADFYRLKMIDADASFEYSNVIEIAGAADGISAALFSNLGRENVLLKCTVNTSSSATYFIFDAEGNLKRRATLQCQSGNNSFALSIVDLPSGNYFMQIILDSYHFNLRFEKE